MGSIVWNIATVAWSLMAIFAFAFRGTPSGVLPILAGVAVISMVVSKRFVSGHRGVMGLALLAGMLGGLGGQGLNGPMYPMVYGLFAVMSVLLGLRATLLALSVFLGVLVALVQQDMLSLATGAFHAGFTTAFAGLFGAILAGETTRLRRTTDEGLAQAWSRIERDAQDFRLIGSTLGPQSGAKDPHVSEQLRKLGSVRAIREGLLDILEATLVAVRADGATLFVLDDADKYLTLKECVAREGEPLVLDAKVAKSEGVLGAVMKTGRAVNLVAPEGISNLGVRVRVPVRSLTAVVVSWSKRPVGVLMVSRTRPEGFSTDEETVLETMTREVVRAMESERIFATMDQVKHEQEKFHETFALLNGVQSMPTFAERLLDAVARIRTTDCAAVTLYEEGVHTVIGHRGDAAWSSLVDGAVLRDEEGGWVVEAIRRRESLPAQMSSRQDGRPPSALFGEALVPKLAATKVFPIVHGDHPLGALIVASRTLAPVLRPNEQRMLEAVCAYGAVTLANVRLFQKMETMATTDGLTGLVNHRRFKELLDEALARATRFARRVSVLMVDADHFKSVNDTYGHAVGDLVLKRIASILKAEARRTDVVARYGGEEFVLMLDETDTEGGFQVAERIRMRIAAEVIEGDFGRVRVTASLGLATWPDHAGVRADLMERADQALYEAKHGGRNRVVVHRPQRCAHGEGAAIPRVRAQA